MTYYPMSEYTLQGYIKSTRAGKKYDALISRNIDKKIVHIPFGDLNYEHYKDSTPNKLYTHLNHGDEKRRRSYRSRHKKNLRPGNYSAGYFSYNKLW